MNPGWSLASNECLWSHAAHKKSGMEWADAPTPSRQDRCVATDPSLWTSRIEQIALHERSYLLVGRRLEGIYRSLPTSSKFTDKSYGGTLNPPHPLGDVVIRPRNAQLIH